MVIRRVLVSALFPYTTLFRSRPTLVLRIRGIPRKVFVRWNPCKGRSRGSYAALCALYGWRARLCRGPRSEEHTSEIQSPCNLVCRLLLEKKKKVCKNNKIMQQ